MAVIGQGISHAGLTQEKFHYAFYVAAGITTSDVGKAVSIDTSADHTVKLAADGDHIIGRLEVVEIRSVEGVNVGTVATRGGLKLPIKTGETFTAGDTAVGAGGGEVKVAAAADHTANVVTGVVGTTHVEILL